MNIEQYIEFCLSLPGTQECFPFDSKTLVFKVGGKMYALTNIDTFESINLKCFPEKSLELRAQYLENIFPGYHMNKKHWNTVLVNERVADKVIFELIKHSYRLVFDNLPNRTKRSIAK